ncbi:ATP-binding protein [Streptomyces purpureus]|uniref:ATP-binding protein n=2 Tax=Streptomyces purpureus TaxID=1951 RepID=A0A918GXC8_9ACTN|nr:ATP-binding protein [Streptomyces purpureus]
MGATGWGMHSVSVFELRGRDVVRVGAMSGQSTRWRRRVGRADLSAVREVRGALRDMLRHWGEAGACDVAELLATELVTNALIHTDHGAEVTATVAPDALRVEVRDHVAGLPGPSHAPYADDGTHGRGLVLLQALADSWGVRPDGAGKVVWFELNGKATA